MVPYFLVRIYFYRRAEAKRLEAEKK